MKSALKPFLFSGILLATLCLSSCASDKTYQPEVGGEGAISSHGDVVFSIPPESPVINMKLVSMVAPKENSVHIRMYFHRKGAAAGEYLDPREQSLLLPDSQAPIYPSHVFASAAGKPLIQLTDTERQWVELVFPLPDTGSHKYSYLQLNWKVHYRLGGRGLFSAQTERFDYVSKKQMQASAGPTGGAAADLEFPSGDFYGPMPNDWETPGWIWW